MRLVFFILLLANVAVLGYFSLQPWMGDQQAKPRAALHPESIQLKPAGDEPAAQQIAGAPAKRVCIEWSGLSEAALAKARDALEKLGLKDKVVLPSTTDFWVYVPPFKTLKEAEKKLGEIKALGVDDAVIVDDAGKWRYAISLAAFASSKEAEFHLKQLRDRGIKSAKMMERHPAVSTLTIVEVEDSLRPALDKLKADFDKSEMKSVQCDMR